MAYEAIIEVDVVSDKYPVAHEPYDCRRHQDARDVVPATAELVTLEPVNAGRAVLGAADINGRAIKVNFLPAQIDQLANPQRMQEGHADQQPVTNRVATIAGGV